MKNLLLALVLALVVMVPVQAQNRMVLWANRGETTISRHIYGHFSEHLGRCIYGGLYVGEQQTTIPHVRGIRQDVVEALRRIRIPNLRWPGGCFADTYHWKQGIGPKAERPSIVNTWWGGVVEDNSFGTHEFLDLAEQLGAEPYISANVGSGTVQELAEWIQYVNFDGESPMSRLRQANGREQPWKVRFWGIGNEAWGCGGEMRVEHYVDVYRQYATFMRASWGDDRLFRIASGANSSDYHWTEVLMRDIPSHMLEGVALHHYSVIDWNRKSSATGFTEQEYFATMQRAWFMEELVRKHSAIMDRYDPEKKVALVVDEWGGWYEVEPGTNPGFLYQQNTLRDAMIAGVTLNIFNNHADRVRMANLAQTVNVLQAVILTEEERLLLTPTYHVMEMYNVHQDATLLPITLESQSWRMDTAALPAISASASRDHAGRVHLSLVNIDARQPQVVSVKVEGTAFDRVQGRILTATRLQAHNTFDQPEIVHPVVFTGARLNRDSLEVTMPPFSVVVLELQ